jgi:PAS domain S-box-containing protein
VAKRTEELMNSNSALQMQIDERIRTEQELRQSHGLLRTLVDNLPDIIFVKDDQSRFLLLNRGCALQLGVARPDDAIGKSDADFVPPELARRYRADEVTLMQAGKTVHQEEPTLYSGSGKTGCSLTTKLPIRNDDGKVIGLMGIARDITPLKEAERKIETIHNELMIASRTAGMAEVAISVLHNVGNVLNSVNTSAGLIIRKLRRSNVTRLAKLSRLLQEHEGDLGVFLSQDDRGRAIIPYFSQLVDQMQEEHGTLQTEAGSLLADIEHINAIISAQQENVSFGGVVQDVELSELVEDAIKTQKAAYEEHHISVFLEFEPVPTISADRHKVLQILVNLLTNANHACCMSSTAQKKVRIRIAHLSGDQVTVQVADNGVGIAPENLSCIFSNGFATRKGGHGFGLHSAALAARELGGHLDVRSDGEGKGATFALNLPLRKPPATAA